MKKVKLTDSGKIKPKKANILCIILKEGKGTNWIWLQEHDEKFSVDGNTYFKQESGTYLKNSIRIMVYLEGISLPIHHGYIEREERTVEIQNEKGILEKIKVSFIKGLKFDSKIIDIILNRNIMDALTKQHVDLPNLIIILLLLGTIIVGIINIGMWWL